ncbi:hypothetical protein SUGI_0954190 [Cryptomeria japonica]|uniref:F-box/FBD/LRR-repeat protein At5g56420 n=1 Tax=Cryptomeria japonica TaxID=3369 RepID=UPI00241498A9|nr:F-box/FBD/LRR-repeat protein At5g56420 [Cryptomeria japonica]GLJ45332.1 hypothetical protein SUGI_0954190 [Cryptomeria japonica]
MARTNRLSALSDDILLKHILSKISYRDVVRSSLLSQRWRFLWKKIPDLVFCCQDFEKQKDDKIQAIIDNALLHHDARLCWLNLQIAMDDPKTANMNNWIRLAAEKQVERMALLISYRDPKTGERIENSSMVDIGDSVFKCENLTTLQLKFINLPKIPTDFGVFRYLKTFFCFDMPNVDDATFKGFMDLCPHLRNLGICGCLRLKNLNIHSCILMYLNLGIVRPNMSLQMVCPQLTEISLIDCGRYQGLKLLQGISRGESVKKIILQNYSRGNAVNPGIPSITVVVPLP